MKILPFALIALTLTLPACASKTVGELGAADGLSASYSIDAVGLGRDAALELAQRYEPAKTPIILQCVPGDFCETFEKSLRDQGFAILTQKGENQGGVIVAPVTDALPDMSYAYAEIRTSDGKFFSIMRRLEEPKPSDAILPAIKNLNSLNEEATTPQFVTASTTYSDVPPFNGFAVDESEPQTEVVYIDTNKERALAQAQSGAGTVSTPEEQAIINDALQEDTAPPNNNPLLQAPLQVVVTDPRPETWELVQGSLYSQLSEWTEVAGYQLVWNAENDLLMMTSATFKGTLEEVMRSLFNGLAKRGHSFVVTFYRANNVMEVEGE
ncbi:MAG: TcpQ domain-containing protein [Pseudomonadota bacterium]